MVVEKSKEAGEFAKEVAIDVKDNISNKAEAEKKRQEEEKKKKKGRGPFGLF